MRQALDGNGELAEKEEAARTALAEKQVELDTTRAERESALGQLRKKALRRGLNLPNMGIIASS